MVGRCSVEPAVFETEIRNVVETLYFVHPAWKRDHLSRSRSCPNTAAINPARLLVRALVHVERWLVLLVDMPTDDGLHDGSHDVCVPFHVFLARSP